MREGEVRERERVNAQCVATRESRVRESEILREREKEEVVREWVSNMLLRMCEKGRSS